MYAIALDLDGESLGSQANRAVSDPHHQIGEVLQKLGFHRRQGSVYFGGATINAGTCVLAAFELARVPPWFSASVRDIRMLRIEESNDLMPAVQQVMT